MNISQAAETATNVVQSGKTAVAVSAGTATAGISKWLGWIPDDIGKLATLIGICLSLALLYFHIRKGLLELKKVQLEYKMVKRKEQDDYEHYTYGKDRRQDG